MTIRVICPGCGATLQAPAALEGSEIECGECGGSVLVRSRSSGPERRSFGRGLGRAGTGPGNEEYAADEEDGGGEGEDEYAPPPRRAPRRRPLGRRPGRSLAAASRGPTFGSIIAIGAGSLLLFLGIFLPWATLSGDNGGTALDMKAGFDRHWGGMLVLIAAIAGLVIAAAAWFDRRIGLVALLPAGAAVTGAVVAILAFSSLDKIIQVLDVKPAPSRSLTGHSGFGIPVALLGAFVLAAGGLAAFQEGQRLARRRPRESEPLEDEEGEGDGEEDGVGPLEYDHDEEER